MDVAVNQPFTDLLQDLIDEVLENHGQDRFVDPRELRRGDCNAVALQLPLITGLNVLVMHGSHFSLSTRSLLLILSVGLI